MGTRQYAQRRCVIIESPNPPAPQPQAPLRLSPTSSSASAGCSGTEERLARRQQHSLQWFCLSLLADIPLPEGVDLPTEDTTELGEEVEPQHKEHEKWNDLGLNTLQ